NPNDRGFARFSPGPVGARAQSAWCGRGSDHRTDRNDHTSGRRGQWAGDRNARPCPVHQSNRASLAQSGGRRSVIRNSNPNRALADVQALVFDVFGTVVDWRSGAARESKAFLARHAPGADAEAFADAWRRRYSPAMEEVRSPHVGQT